LAIATRDVMPSTAMMTPAPYIFAAAVTHKADRALREDRDGLSFLHAGTLDGTETGRHDVADEERLAIVDRVGITIDEKSHR